MSNLHVRALGLLAAFLVACEGTGTVQPPDSAMQVRLVNAIEGTSDLQLRAKGVTVLAQVAPGTASGFAEIPADATELVIQRRFGAGSISVPIVPVADGLFAATVMGDDDVLYANVATIAQADTGRAVAGRANFRAINLASAAPAPEIDIHVTAPGAPLTGVTPAWQMWTYLALYTGLKDFPPGQLQVRITLEGTTTVVAESPVLTVGADEIRVITIRRITGNQFEVVVAVEQGQ